METIPMESSTTTTSPTLFFTILITLTTTLYLLYFHFLSRTLTGPKLYPFVGSLPGLINNFTNLHDWITSNLASSPTSTYQTSLLPFPFLARKQGLVTVTCNPSNLEHILKSNFHNYPKGPHWHSVFHDLLGDGIFNSDGDTWRAQRKTAALEFTTRTLRLAMGKWVSRAVRLRLGPVLKRAEMMGEVVDIQDLMLRLTFDNICGLAFGRDPMTLAPSLPENVFASAFDNATEASLQRFVFPSLVWKLRKWMKLGMESGLCHSLKEIDSYLTEVINARKQELLLLNDVVDENKENLQQHDDLLSRFMRRKSTSSSSSSSDDKFLQQVALNFILAGRDTSSVAMTWFFWLITQHPQTETKILNELITILNTTRDITTTTNWLDQPLTYEEAENLVYLKAALSETLRLYPSVPEDSKYVNHDDILPDGTHVPGGSSVTYSIYAAGRMKSTWGEDCMEFKPERWVEFDGNGVMRFKKCDQFRFVAFNAGPRVCLGKELAYLQMKTVAAAVLLRHKLVVVDGFKVEQKMSLTLFMKYGLRVNVYARDLTEILKEVKAQKEMINDRVNDGNSGV